MLVARLREHDRAAGLLASPIQTFEDLAADPQAWANDYFLKTHCSEVDREVEIMGEWGFVGRG